MDGSLVWLNRYHQSGTLMPSGAVHPIFASGAKQSILVCVLMDCFAPLAMTAYFIGCISSQTLRMRPRIYLICGSEDTSSNTAYSIAASRPYSTPRKNLFDFGRPCARRPASARLPRQSVNSLGLIACSRPAESFQVRPVL